MLASGQQYPVNATNPLAPAAPVTTTPSYPGQPYSGPQMGGVGFTPIMPQMKSLGLGSMGNVSMNIGTEKLDKGQAADYLKSQQSMQMWGAGGDLLLQLGQTVLAGFAMDCQRDVARKYYTTQTTIAGYQKDCVLAGLNTQNKQIETMERVTYKQQDHEKGLAQLANSVQTKLAQIAEAGKTDRAKIMAMSNAFAKTGYNYGQPMAA